MFYSKWKTSKVFQKGQQNFKKYIKLLQQAQQYCEMGPLIYHIHMYQKAALITEHNDITQSSPNFSEQLENI